MRSRFLALGPIEELVEFARDDLTRSSAEGDAAAFAQRLAGAPFVRAQAGPWGSGKVSIAT
jgi:hypothetical protein